MAWTAGARVPVKDRTQSARPRVDQPTIRGRTCANLGYYKPLFACGDRTFSNQFIAPARAILIWTPSPAKAVPPPENASPIITSSEPVVLSRPTTSAAAELSVRGRLTGSLWTSNAVHPEPDRQHAHAGVNESPR